MNKTNTNNNETQESYLVLIEDLADGWLFWEVVAAPSEEWALRNALDQIKERRDVADESDEEHGVQAVMLFCRDELIQLLAQMDKVLEEVPPANPERPKTPAAVARNLMD